MYKRQVSALRKALSLNHDQVEMQEELGQELLGTQDNKNLPEVVKLLSHTLELDPTNDSYRQIATAYYGLGQEGEADLATAQASVLEGKPREAKGFAKRAQALLTKGSQGWLKADDIINIQDPDAQ